MNKEIIQKCIEYLRQVSLQEPIDFHVEETGINRVVLSFRYNTKEYWWEQRTYKEFIIRDNKVEKMKNFNV